MILTSTVYLPLRFALHRLAERVSTDKFEIFGGGVHLGSLHIRDDDENVIATVVVHAAQEHKFGEHGEYHRHHGQLAVLHRAMVVYMRGPCTVEGDHAGGIDRAHENVLRNKVALAPSKQLFSALQSVQGRVSAFAHAHKPLPVRVVAVL